MKELIDEGLAGDIWQVNSYWNLQFMMQPYAIWPYKGLSQEDSGLSAIRDMGSHALNTIVSLIGRISRVVAPGNIFLNKWLYSDGTTAIPQNVDTVSMLLRFANGGQGSFQSSRVTADGSGWALEIFGSKGRRRAENPAYPTAGIARPANAPPPWHAAPG
jgi:predicted dehydrogenase